MKRFLICLFSFLFIGCSIAGGAILLSNQSYSDENRGGDSSNSENDVIKNAPTNDDLWTDSGNYATSFAGGDGTEDDPYQIATAGQLAYLAYLINNSSTNSTYSALYYIQIANIDLTLHYWEPIGTYTSASSYLAFAGSFNGGGYTISGIYTISTNDYQGLFGYTRGGIRNEYGSYFSYLYGIGVINSNITGNSYVGGIVGYAYATSIYRCFNTSPVSGKSNVGGIIGYLLPPYGGSFSDMYNSGVITGEEYVGGIIGYCYSSAPTNCLNYGTISGNNYVGGISGYSQGHWGNPIFNCVSAGEVLGETNVGAIAGGTGSMSGSNYSYWSEEMTVDVAFGYNYNASGSNISNTVRVSESLMKNLSWYTTTSNWYSSYPWDFVNTWVIVEGANNGFPVLRGNSTIMTYHSNFGDDEIVSQQYDLDANVVIESGDLFEREGYNFLYWNTEANGGGLTFLPGDSYTGSVGLTLYAIWEEVRILEISLNPNGGSGGTETIWLKYNDGYYSNNTATGSAITSLTSLPTRAGYSFYGYYTNSTTGNLVIASDGTIRVNNTYFTGNTTLYAQWVANNPAMYDEEGEYWYVELGMMPQTKVTDETTISALNGTGLTSGNNYRFGDLLLESSVYGNEEYCEYNGNWYRVEPIRWRLDYSTSQTVGFGTTDDTLAVMDTIVFVSQFSETELNVGDGYSDTAVTGLLESFAETAYFVTETKSMPTFGSSTINGTAERVTSNIFVASREEIAEVAGNGKIQFSDLVKDYLLANGQLPLYYTRDLGTNYNNIFCMNGNGESVQYKPQNYFGVQFSVLITEYACV